MDPDAPTQPSLFGRLRGRWRAAHGDRSDEWLTPLWMIEALGPFDFDPCGVHDWPTAARVNDIDAGGDNALAMPWPDNALVWLNPPYSDPAPFLRRLRHHGPGGLALLPVRSDAAWFQELAPWASTHLLLAERVRFVPPPGVALVSNRPRYASILLAFGWQASIQLQRGRRRGIVGVTLGDVR